jgi:hypothetical protein
MAFPSQGGADNFISGFVIAVEYMHGYVAWQAGSCLQQALKYDLVHPLGERAERP